MIIAQNLMAQVLLVGGRRATSGQKTPEAYVFDSLLGTYTRTSTDPYGSEGSSHMGCVLKPWDSNVILCAGGHRHSVVHYKE